MLTRRKFLLGGGLVLGTSAAVPAFLWRAAQVAQENGPVAAASSMAIAEQAADTILVVVQMSGGNDGLNTVVPYGLDGYREARTTLGIDEADVLPITDHIGLHPVMGRIHELYQSGQVAIVQGVGYPNPNLSHFRSMDIWHTAAPDSYETRGWLADYLTSTSLDDTNPIYSASVTSGLSRALYGPGVAVPAVASLAEYQFHTDPQYPDDRAARLAYASSVFGLDYRHRPLEEHVARTAVNAIASSERVQEAAQAYTSDVSYPSFPLATSLQTVAQLMAGNLGTRIYYVAFGGFDTHSAQAATHERLLSGFSDSVGAFFEDVAQMGKAEQVLLMTMSEFGRRVQENGSNGTDHGTAGPMFLVGSNVKGGLYGEHPSLQDLDANRNLTFGIDFRAVYGTALGGWLAADPQAVLGETYENIGFV